MSLNVHFTLNSVFGQVQVQDLLIDLYGQRRDIYGMVKVTLTFDMYARWKYVQSYKIF